MNIQFAVKNEELFVIEVNPRASRTVPFVSKAIGKPLAKMAAKIMVGEKLSEMGMTERIIPPYYCVKEAVFPWPRFPGIDIVLGPEMKSTGEVMGIDEDLGMAYAKSQISGFNPLPLKGNVFLSVSDGDKDEVVPIAKQFVDAGFTLFATGGTFRKLEEAEVPVQRLYKLSERKRPNVLDMMKNGEIDFIVNTPSSHESREDEVVIRSAAVANKVSHCTNLAAAEASVMAIRSLQEREFKVTPLQDYYL
jgi:carbamoyl-phosphate synthase large subunit